MAQHIYKDYSSTPPGKSNIFEGFTQDDYILSDGEIVEIGGVDKIVLRRKVRLISGMKVFMYDIEDASSLRDTSTKIEALITALEEFLK